MRNGSEADAEESRKDNLKCYSWFVGCYLYSSVPAEILKPVPKQLEHCAVVMTGLTLNVMPKSSSNSADTESCNCSVCPVESWTPIQG